MEHLLTQTTPLHIIKLEPPSDEPTQQQRPLFSDIIKRSTQVDQAQCSNLKQELPFEPTQNSVMDDSSSANSPSNLGKRKRKAASYVAKSVIEERFLQHQAEIQRILAEHNFPSNFTAEYVKNMNSSYYAYCIQKSQQLTLEQKGVLKECMKLIRPEVPDHPIGIEQRRTKKESTPESSRKRPKLTRDLIFEEKFLKHQEEIEDILLTYNFPSQFTSDYLRSMKAHYFKYCLYKAKKLTEVQKEALKQIMTLIRPKWIEELNDTDKKDTPESEDDSEDADETPSMIRKMSESSLNMDETIETSERSTLDDEHLSELYYAKMDQQLRDAGVNETLKYIMSLDMQEFWTYRTNSGFTKEQKQFISYVRKRGKEREWKKPIANSEPQDSDSVDNSDSKPIPIQTDDLDAILYNAGITVTCKDIMQMSNSTYHVYKHANGLTQEQKKVVCEVRAKIRKRFYQKGYRDPVQSKSNIHANSSPQYIKAQIKQAGVSESVEAIRNMSEDEFERYLLYKNLEDGQEKLLRSIWNKLKEEKDAYDKVQKILDESHLPYTVDRLKAMDRKRYCKIISEESTYLTKKQKKSLQKCMALIRPKFAEECAKSEGIPFEHVAADPMDNDTNPTKFLSPLELLLEQIKRNSVGTVEIGASSSGSQEVLCFKNEESFLDGDTSPPAVMPSTSKINNELVKMQKLENPISVGVQELANGKKIFIKESDKFPGHVYTYRLRNLIMENMDFVEIYECESCMEASTSAPDTLKAVKVLNGKIIEGDYDGQGHICVSVELQNTA